MSLCPVRIFVTEAEREAWSDQAEREGLSRVEWMRKRLNAAAKPDPVPPSTEEGDVHRMTRSDYEHIFYARSYDVSPDAPVIPGVNGPLSRQYRKGERI